MGNKNKKRQKKFGTPFAMANRRKLLLHKELRRRRRRP